MESLSELDRHLKQLQYSDFLMLNVFSKQCDIKAFEKIQQAYVMLALGFFAFVVAYFITQDSIAFAITIIMGLSLLMLGLQSQRQSNVQLLITASVILVLTVIFMILYQFVWISNVSLSGMILCIVFTAGVLYFIGQANQAQTSPIELPPHLAQIYQATAYLLAQQKPNQTNKLIIIRHLASQTKIWLRSDTSVILHTDSLFFDASSTLSLELQGSDVGSNLVSVVVNYGDVHVSGRISRYDWLRYLQFAS